MTEETTVQTPMRTSQPDSTPGQPATKKRRRKGLVVTLIIVALIILGAAGFVGYRWHKASELNRNLAILDREIDKIAKTDKVDPKIYCGGQVTSLERSLKDQFKSLISARDAYLAAFEKTQDDLDPNSFANDDTDFSAHLEDISDLESASDSFFGALTDFAKPERWERELAKIDLSDADRSQVLATITTDMKGWPESLDKAQDAQGKMTDSLASYYAFLTKNRPSWTVQEGVLTYNSQTLLDEDNKISNDTSTAANDLVDALNGM